MSLVLRGISVCKGFAIGKANPLKRDELDVSEYTVPKPLLGEEIERFRIALRKAKQQLEAVRKRIPGNTPADIVAFIDAHLLMLEDAAFAVAPIEIIKTRQCNAEWALKLQRDALVRVFEDMEDPYLRTRKDDVDHVVERVQRNLLEQYGAAQERAGRRLGGCIAIADDISPAEVMLLQQQGIAAFVTEYGGPNSHTAILARSLGLPAIVGAHHVQQYLQKHETLVIDGQRGIVLAAPDAVELAYYRKQQRKEKHRQAELRRLRGHPALTRDGQTIRLMANIEVPGDVAMVKRAGAAGIGLYRTEMLFLNRERLPDEEEQFAAYAHVVRAMRGAPVTIRTLDLGADKQPSDGHRPATVPSNPALGLRAIRWSLKDPELFAPQIRAILRASHFGAVRVMIPMLSTLNEALQVLRLIEDEKRTLEKRRVRFDPAVQVGGMIEIPAAALAADAFTRHMDFLSLGTNDLIQYALAVDRLDDEVNYLYDPLHPAILRLIQMTINAGKKAGIPVAMCGEMAGDTRYTRLLLGMGLREFSMYPATLPEVKLTINNSDIGILARYARKALRMTAPDEIALLVDQLNALD